MVERKDELVRRPVRVKVCRDGDNDGEIEDCRIAVVPGNRVADRDDDDKEAENERPRPADVA